MSNQALDTPEPVIPFAPKRKKDTADLADPLDTAEQDLVGVIQRAAGIAEARSQQLRDLTAKLRATENRIKELEDDVRHYQSRANRAEKCLFQISAEIRQGFLDSDDSRAQPATLQTIARALGQKD